MADTTNKTTTKPEATGTVLDVINQQQQGSSLTAQYERRNSILAQSTNLEENPSVKNSLKRMDANTEQIDKLTKDRDAIISKKNAEQVRLSQLQLKLNDGSASQDEINEMNQLRKTIVDKEKEIKRLNIGIKAFEEENVQMTKVLKEVGAEVEYKGGKHSLKINPKTEQAFYKNPVNPSVLNTLQKIEKRLTPLSDAEIKELKEYGSDDLYNKARAEFLKSYSQGYKYNIRNNFNEKLFDIRNYRNFRSLFANSSNPNANENFTKSVMGGGTCASRSFYMSKKDFYWSQNYLMNYDEEGNRLIKDPVQNIILNEYQPVFGYNLAKTLVKLGGGFVDGLGATSLMAGDVGKEVLGLGANVAINKLVDNYSKDPTQLYNQENYQGNTIAGVPLNPMYYVKHLFSDGQWLNTYQLPFINVRRTFKKLFIEW